MQISPQKGLKRLTPTQRKARALDVWDRHVIKGETTFAIGAHYGITPRHVLNDVEVIEKEMTARIEQETRRRIARHVRVYEHALKEALEAWEKSKEGKTWASQKKRQGRPPGRHSNGNEGRLLELDSTTEGGKETSVGDPRFLELAMKALGGIEKIWPGMLAATRLQFDVSVVDERVDFIIQELVRTLPKDVAEVVLRNIVVLAAQKQGQTPKLLDTTGVTLPEPGDNGNERAEGDGPEQGAQE